MAQVATRLILGQTLVELGYEDGLYPEGQNVHVKAPVFSFTKLAKVDSLLGPEMKSTGEVMEQMQLLKKLYTRLLKPLIYIFQTLAMLSLRLRMKIRKKPHISKTFCSDWI